MTEKMEGYFRSLISTMSEKNLLKFGVVNLNSNPIAITLGFDYNNTLYLYNSAYNPEFDSLSAGLVSKALSIKTSIEEGKKRYDFLKGEETYKFQLGGKAVPIYNCQITIS